MKLSPSQKRCFAAARQACVDVLPKLEWLQNVAGVAPQYADEVRELMDLRDHLMTLCEACSSLDTSGGS